MDSKQFLEAIETLVSNAANIAYAKKCLYDAYVMEGFTPEQALELTKF
jgi:hypothetical protein